MILISDGMPYLEGRKIKVIIMYNRLKFLIDAVGWPVVFLSPVVMSILVIGWLYMCQEVDRNTRTSFDTLVNHEVEVLSQRLKDY